MRDEKGGEHRPADPIELAHLGLSRAKAGLAGVVDRIDPGILADVVIKATALQEVANRALSEKGSPYRINGISITATIPPQVSFGIGRVAVDEQASAYADRGAVRRRPSGAVTRVGPRRLRAATYYPRMEQRNPWRRLSRRVAYENPWLTLWHDEVIRPDGNPGIYGTVHFANNAIGVVPIDAEDRVLLVGQYRYTLDEYSWEIPEGGGRLDEEPLEAAKRELLEETGFSARTWRELLRATLSNSVSDERAVLYVATDLTPGDARPEPTEELAIRWAPFEEAVAMSVDGRITDGMSILALQRLALERRGPIRTPARRPRL